MLYKVHFFFVGVKKNAEIIQRFMDEKNTAITVKRRGVLCFKSIQSVQKVPVRINISETEGRRKKTLYTKEKL